MDEQMESRYLHGQVEIQVHGYQTGGLTVF